jgi:hypothetical protein
LPRASRRVLISVLGWTIYEKLSIKNWFLFYLIPFFFFLQYILLILIKILFRNFFILVLFSFYSK